MPHFQLGGSVSTLNSSEPTFSSDFAKELAKESSMLTNNDSVYKSSFATELLESSVSEMVQSDDHQENDDSNIYENINVRESLGNQSLPCPFLDDSSDFKRLSQVSFQDFLLKSFTFLSGMTNTILTVWHIFTDFQQHDGWLFFTAGKFVEHLSSGDCGLHQWLSTGP